MNGEGEFYSSQPLNTGQQAQGYSVAQRNVLCLPGCRSLICERTC